MKKSAATYTIRHTEPRDYARVKQLLFKEGMIYSNSFTRRGFNLMIKDFRRYCFVAEDGGKVVGHIWGFDDSGKSGRVKFSGYVGRLVIDPKYRRQGIGRKLTELCMREFRRAGCSIVFAGVHKRNLASRGMLKKIGFEDKGYNFVFMHPR